MRRTKIFQKFKLFCSEATNNEMPLSYDKSKSGKFHLTQAKFSTPPPPTPSPLPGDFDNRTSHQFVHFAMQTDL